MASAKAQNAATYAQATGSTPWWESVPPEGWMIAATATTPVQARVTVRPASLPKWLLPVAVVVGGAAFLYSRS